MIWFTESSSPRTIQNNDKRGSIYNKRTGTYPSDVTMMKTGAGYIQRSRAKSRGAKFGGFVIGGVQESTAAENTRWRRRTLDALFLAVSLEAGDERSTAENARRRQRTLYPLVSSKARRSRNDLSDRLSKTLDRGRERSTPWSRRRLWSY